MINRLIGILCIAAMLGVNGMLVIREFIPRWAAGDPPKNDAQSMKSGDIRRTQFGIYTPDGQLVGRSWTLAMVNFAPSLTVDSWSVVEPYTLPNGMSSPRLRVHTIISYVESDVPDKVRLELEGVTGVDGRPLRIGLEGEPIPPDFACTWVVGDDRGEFAVPSDSMRAVGDVLKPFDRLPGLFVGRAWQLNVFDPLSRILPHWMRGDIDSDAVLVRVTKSETIQHAGQDVEVFRIEAPHVVAWATLDGRVLRQEVEVPILGPLVILDEEWSAELFRAAREAALAPHFGEGRTP